MGRRSQIRTRAPTTTVQLSRNLLHPSMSSETNDAMGVRGRRQRLPSARGRLGGGADRGPQRRRLLAGTVALGLRRDRPVAGTRAPRALARLRRLRRYLALQRGPGARRVPRPSRSRAPAQRRRAQRADRHARAPERRAARRRGPVRGHPPGLLRRSLPLARRRRRARSPGPRDRLDERGGGDGHRTPQPPDVGRAVPSRVDRHRAWPQAVRELLRARRSPPLRPRAAGGRAAHPAPASPAHEQPQR